MSSIFLYTSHPIFDSPEIIKKSLKIDGKIIAI